MTGIANKNDDAISKTACGLISDITEYSELEYF
jgi:hypothetical protein